MRNQIPITKSQIINNIRLPNSNGLKYLYDRCLEFGDYHLPSSSSFLPASGKKRGDPNLSTPKVLMISWVPFETIKSANAFPPAAFTLGHLAGLISMT